MAKSNETVGASIRNSLSPSSNLSEMLLNLLDEGKITCNETIKFFLKESAEKTKSSIERIEMIADKYCTDTYLDEEDRN